MMRRNSRPGLRPLNRKRENAYAPNVARVRDRNVDNPQTMSELMNHRPNPVFPNRFSKFTGLKFVGMMDDELSVPSGLKAADATKRIGKSAKMQARIATR
jgi:hypothetical protein